MSTDQASSESLKLDSESFFNMPSQHSDKRNCFICDSTDTFLQKKLSEITAAQT